MDPATVMQLPAPQSHSTTEGRIVEILGLVRKAFIEKGFDGASMQDLARTAGMSVGNFYRYFPSKDAIVEALVALDMDEIDREFSQIAQSDDPMGVLRHVIAAHINETSCDDDGALWAEIAAAARRKPRIAEVSARMEQAIVDKLVTVFRLATGASDPATTQRFTTEARVLVMLVKACAMRPVVAIADDAELKPRVQRIIDDILNSISRDDRQC